MLTLPDHLPVLWHEPPKNPGEAELKESLLRVLEAEGFVVSRVDDSNTIAKPQDVVAHLIHADLLLTSGNLVADPPSLLFSATPASGRKAPKDSFICQSSADLHSCVAGIKRWLDRCESSVSLAGAVLIGGKSSRMGRPKHLIRHPSGETWLERSLATLGPFVDELFISGAGELPPALKDTPRVADLAGVQGPLAGIGALLKERPWSSWLVMACDMPDVKAPAITWLLNQRGRRYRVIIARNPSTGRSEPLLAWYDYRSAALINDLIGAGGGRVRELIDNELTSQPWIPDHLADCWRNVNYPEELGSKDPTGP